MNLSQLLLSQVPSLRSVIIQMNLFLAPASWGIAYSIFTQPCTKEYMGKFSNNCTINKSAFVMVAAAFTALSIYIIYDLHSIYRSDQVKRRLSDALGEGEPSRPKLDEYGDAAIIVLDGSDVGQEYRISKLMLKSIMQAHQARDNRSQQER